MDIRLKTVPFEFRGKKYNLCCNNNVLADVQEWNGGTIKEALDGKRGLKSTLQFLAAMINDAADSAGEDLVVTPREVGRELTLNQITDISATIRSLIISAVVVESEEGEEKK